MTLACLCLLHKLKSYSTFQKRRCLINTWLSQWRKEWMDELKIMPSNLKWLVPKSPSRATVRNWNPLFLNFYLLLPSLGTQSTCHIGEHTVAYPKNTQAGKIQLCHIINLISEATLSGCHKMYFLHNYVCFFRI